MQMEVHAATGHEGKPATHTVRQEHPLSSVPCSLGRSQHPNHEYRKERDTNATADPPCSDAADDIENSAFLPTKAPSLSIVEYGERAAEVLRQHTQSL